MADTGAPLASVEPRVTDGGKGGGGGVKGSGGGLLLAGKRKGRGLLDLANARGGGCRQARCDGGGGGGDEKRESKGGGTPYVPQNISHEATFASFLLDWPTFDNICDARSKSSRRITSCFFRGFLGVFF